MNFRRTIARSAVLNMSLAVTAFASGAGRVALTPWMVAHASTASTCDRLPSNSSPKLGERAADFMSTQPSLSCTQSTSRHSERQLELQHSLSNAPQLSAAVTLASATDLARPSRVLSRA